MANDGDRGEGGADPEPDVSGEGEATPSLDASQPVQLPEQRKPEEALVDWETGACPVGDWGQSDEEFGEWLVEELRQCTAYRAGPECADVLEAAAEAAVRWRGRFRAAGAREAWLRLWRNRRLVKEFNESAPVVARALAVAARLRLPPGRTATVLDLCSGVGYTSMLLSELLPRDKVGRIILCDRAWPMNNEEAPQPHHINWAHVYLPGWPIPMSTSKRNLKAASSLRDLDKHLFRGSAAGCPVLVLGVHLCSTLSIRAVEIFNTQPTAAHAIPATDVCAKGKWNKKGWRGGDRSLFETRFEAWAEHLYCGVEPGEGGDCAKCRAAIQVQEKHFQNAYIFAERGELLTGALDSAGVAATAAGLLAAA
eukprot:jgi/Tetstr1/425568/TSEL_015991.t1